MARPNKPADSKRSKRLTVYFTPQEEERLTMVAELLQTDRTKFIIQAIDKAISTLNTPPPSLVQSKEKEIMAKNEELLTGFICSNGHLFWLEWAWPSAPEHCPCCNSKQITTTWAGKIKKGFSSY